MLARKLRYNWFHDLLNKNRYECIAVGHHFDDSIETFFINLIRGTGIKGLLGIPKYTKEIIRPLFNFRKKDILSYAKENNIKWRLDCSNFETKYIRNKVRLTLGPILNSFSYNLYNGIKNTMNFLHDESILIEKNINKIHDDITIYKKSNPFIWKINNEKLKKFNPLYFYLFKLFYPYGFYDINSLIRVLDAESGKKLFSKKYCLIKDRNCWIVIKNEFFSYLNKKKFFYIPNLKLSNKFHLPIKIKFLKKKFYNEYKKNYEKIFFIDFDKIQFPLLLRIYKKDDFFYINKKKKFLIKYYKDNKFSFLEKKQTWLLINGNNDIILITKNCIIDDRYKITDKTKNTLIILIQ